MLDEEHCKLAQSPTDHNIYHLGSIAGRNVVIAGLWQAGNPTAATVVAQMRMTFSNIRFGLLVGIGGGVPVVTEHGMIRLGNVVVSKPVGLYSGAIQYDRGKAETGVFVRTGALAPPPPVLLLAAQALDAERARSREDPLVNNIRRIDTSLPGLQSYRFPGRETDNLFPANYEHLSPGESCEAGQCDLAQRIRWDGNSLDGLDQCITVHRGTIASGELVIKDATKRDLLGREYGVLCFEMEGAGVLNDFPCLVIRGISDYCDSHKNDRWHGFAAAAAAAYARQLFFHMPIDQANPLASGDNTGVSRIIKRSDDQERQKIADWISPTNYATFQADFYDQRQEGTGQWLLDTVEFHEWVQDKGVLFCPGIPGAGKTILSSIIINHLQECCAMKQDIAVTYIFCNYRQQNDQKLKNIIANLLKQLVQALHSIPEDLCMLYKSCQRNGAGLQQDQISKLVLTVANMFSRVYLVIDALDESCDSNGTRGALMSYLLDIQQKCNMSLLVTSRLIPEITAKFEQFHTVEVRASDADVTRFAEGHMHELPNCVKKSTELSKLVVSKIVRSVGGMFLLAKLYWDTLKGHCSVKEVKVALKSLKSGSQASDDAYEGAMKRIEHQIAGQASLAKRLLSWLTCSQRALTLTELQHGLAVEIDEIDFDAESLPDIEDMISVCGGLVTYNERSHIISLVHYTTQEYFDRTWFSWFPNAHSYIGDTCATYLSYDAFASGPCETTDELERRTRQYPLYKYAAKSLGHHSRRQPRNQPLFLKFLQDDRKSAAYDQARLYCSGLFQWEIEDITKRTTGLHLAASLGLDEELEALVNVNCKVDSLNGWGDSPLSLAVAAGHETTVKFLLGKGADPYFQDKYHRTLLLLATVHNHETLVELFLELGLDPQTRDKRDRSPLSYAAENGHERITKLLLDKHAEKDATDRFKGKTPLILAAKKGHREIVRLLLQHKPDVDALDPRGRTTLSHAAKNGHLDLVEFLLSAGAEIDVVDRKGRSPLGWAVYGSEFAVVRFLLEKGANPNIHGGTSTPLLDAVITDNTKTVEILLKYGADPYDNLQTETFSQQMFLRGNGDTLRVLMNHGVKPHPNATDEYSLLWAVVNCCTSFVQLLLEKGTDIDTTDPETGDCALSLAMTNPQELSTSWRPSFSSMGELGFQRSIYDIALELVHRGANIETQNHKGQTPLMKAAQYRGEQMVKLLLNKGAMLRARDNVGQTSLFYALEQGDENIIKLLLETDSALLTCRDSFGRSPLLLAAEARRHDILELVDDQDHCKIVAREVGVILRIIREPGYTLSQGNGAVLLLWASSNGYLAVVNQLLESGISDLCQDGGGRTPLMLAVKSNHLDVIKALLKNDMAMGIRDNVECSALSWAFWIDNEATILLLLEHVADPNEPISLPPVNKGGFHRYYPESSLFLAAQRGYEKSVGFLLKIGADPNFQPARTRHRVRPSGFQSTPGEEIVSPLSEAARNGYHAIAQALLLSGADASACYNSLREAMKQNQDAIVSLILEKIIPNHWPSVEHGEPLLFHAASTGYPDVVKGLLEGGVDPNIRSMQWLPPVLRIGRKRRERKNGRTSEAHTPLFFAAREGHEEVVRVLLSHNADPNIASPLRCAMENGHTTIAELLLHHGGELPVNDNKSLLLEPSRAGHYGVVKLLLDQGIPPEPKHCIDDWQHPLFQSVTERRIDVTQLLIRNGANPNWTNETGAGVLFHAAEKGLSDMVEVLLEHGADANAVDQLGRTALLRAVMFRRFYATKLLLSKGKANPQAMTCAGRTPSSVAHDFHFPELIFLFSGAKHSDPHHVEQGQEDDNEDDHEDYQEGYSYDLWKCHTCHRPISSQDTFFRCQICLGDGSGLRTCIECVAQGWGCYDSLHTLEKMTFVHGKPEVVDKTPRWRHATTLPIRTSTPRPSTSH